MSAQTKSQAPDKVHALIFLEELRRAHESNDTERFKELMNEFTFSDEAATRRTPT